MSLFTLAAKITLDSSEYNKGIDDAKGKLSGLADAAKSGLDTIATLGAAALGAAVTGISAILKESIDHYAEYQQMVGGVQKLYGNMGMSLEDYAKSVGKSTDEVRGEWENLEKAQQMVLDNANNAYKTSGMSANDYMQTATSFSASLINSLGGDTVKAAELTDVAMKAISDNFNTFGGDIGMIQGAFQGFAKQNYQMLDNLKLGYGGTKSEMERLISDANEYAASIGQASDLSIENFGDIIQAIDLIQQKQQIAGTTAREASTTIEGSFMQLKAAWDNLVTGFADPNADIPTLMKNVIDSAATAAGNLIPAIKQALQGVGQAINELLPVALEKIPQLIEDVVIPLVETGANLLRSVGEGLMAAAPEMFETLKTVMMDLFTMMTESLGEMDFEALINQLLEIFNMIVETFGTYTPILLEKGGELLSKLGDGLVEGIPAFLEKILPILTKFTEYLSENAGTLIDMGIELILNLAQGIVNSIPTLIKYIPQIILNITGIINENLPKIMMMGLELALMLLKGIISSIPTLIQEFPKLIKAITDSWHAVNWMDLGVKLITLIGDGINKLAHLVPKILEAIGGKVIEVVQMIDWIGLGKKVISFIGDGIHLLWELLPKLLKSIAETAFDKVKEINWLEVGENIIGGIVDGIGSAAESLVNAAINAAADAIDKVKNWLGIESPSKRARDEIGKWMALGVGAGWEKYMPVDEMNKTMKHTIEDMEIPDTSLLGGVADDVTITTVDDTSKERTGTFAPVINVYASDGQDVRALAQQIMDLITFEYEREGSAFA